MADKLGIQNEMRMFDEKNREFYDELTDEEKKKFSTYLMIRWGSSVVGSRDLQEYYLHASNQRLNKHFFDIYNHPKLQWLCATTVSPGMGNHRHEWIANKKGNKGENNNMKKLKEIFPVAKMDDLRVLSSMVDKSYFSEYKKILGE